MNEQHPLKLEWSLGFHLLSAYLMTAILFLLLPVDVQPLLHLDNQVSFLKYLIFMALFFAMLVAWELAGDRQQYRSLIFSGLASVFCLLVSWQLPSTMVTAGVLIVLLTYFCYLFLNQSQGQRLVLVGLSLLFIRLIYLNYGSNDQTNLGKFTSQFNDQDLQLLWAFMMGWLVGIVIILLNRFGKLQGLKQQKFLWGFLLVAIIAFSTWVFCLVLARVWVFVSPTYDMGIFSQMFANMAKGLGPVTTLERGEVLSHFKVHVSPIHYLLLPIYYLWPSPVTIQAAEIVIVLSGLIPLYLILRHLKWDYKYQITFLLMYLWLPSLTTAHFYDYHENCFLAPLVLWLIYANLRESRGLMALFTVLLLLVKEDAVVYVVAIGLYFFFQRLWPMEGKTRRALVLLELVMPVVYFILVILWLDQFGQGAMTGRFANFMLPDQEGLAYAVMNALKHPSYTVASLFTTTKLKYLLVLLASQAFLPLLQSSWRTYLLTLPLFVINLLSDWPYQADLFKQYHFGSNVLLLFMSVIAVESMQRKYFEKGNEIQTDFLRLSKDLSSLAVVLSFGLVMTLTQPRMVDFQVYQRNPEHYQAIKKTLDQVPRDGRVLALSPFTTPLADVFDLYDLFYYDDEKVDSEVDYIVYPRQGLSESSKEMKVVQMYLQVGYREGDLSSENVVILEKP